MISVLVLFHYTVIAQFSLTLLRFFPFPFGRVLRTWCKFGTGYVKVPSGYSHTKSDVNKLMATDCLPWSATSDIPHRLRLVVWLPRCIKCISSCRHHFLKLHTEQQTHHRSHCSCVCAAHKTTADPAHVEEVLRTTQL